MITIKSIFISLLLAVHCTYGAIVLAPIIAPAGGITGWTLVTNYDGFVFSGDTANLNLPAGTTAYFALNNSRSNAVTTDVSGGTRTLMPRAGVLTNLVVSSSGAMGAGQTNTITLMTNGVATAYVTTISGASDTTNSDNVLSVPVDARGQAGLRMVITSGATARKFNWSVEYK